MIAILVKAAVTAVIIWVTYEIGRCSAVHEIFDKKHGRIEHLSEDIVTWIERYDKKL